ncbi:hypothetical protein ABMY12_22930 [Vibrio vulnificus]|uniref:hypothetical protein n=1 Tax=Vibrio vulnificus TaxID=672 RepID=UPI00102D119F|nr:hypothetical protein [Vibrio vulnificus]EGQ9313582.1 hypothetical protein [Vibrio vulnificus]RZR40414.1 hypothetical protein D8T57_22265 [Vibrio vulnificus]
MSLGPPTDRSVFWRDFRIDEPTFEMSALEKPDMSPYLLHMTGRNEILGILQSGEFDGQGRINSCVPTDSKTDWYDCKVVCFTESPTFAVDAFRYISFRRWQKDHRYGIGFSKAKLVSLGVRPVYYIDNDILGKMAGGYSSENQELQNLMELMLPYVTPLGEMSPKQGFMWEREWRFSSNDGFDFSFDDIEIICCPKEEQNEILRCFGTEVSHIKFIQSWEQYDEVRQFLASKRGVWQRAVREKEYQEDKLTQLKRKLELEVTKSVAYEDYIRKLQANLSQIQDYKTFLQSQIETLEDDLEEIEQDKLSGLCQGCHKSGVQLWEFMHSDGSKKEYCGDCHHEETVRASE